MISMLQCYRRTPLLVAVVYHKVYAGIPATHSSVHQGIHSMYVNGGERGDYLLDSLLVP